jgi:hypothetical protein
MFLKPGPACVGPVNTAASEIFLVTNYLLKGLVNAAASVASIIGESPM